MNLQLVRNPFHKKPGTIPFELQDEFIDVINSTFKTFFAWCDILSSYPRIGKHVSKVLLTFPTTYLCESGFLTLAAKVQI